MTALGSSDAWRPIKDSDETIREALKEASIPALMCAMVHITGKREILDQDFEPVTGFMADPQGGIPPVIQEQVREQAFAALTALRDDSSKLPPVPGPDTIREMMNFIVGQPLAEEYIDFLSSELSLKGEDPYGQPAIEAIPRDKRADFKVAVVGSGMSGILAAIRLKDAGISYEVFEKNANVGGTWFENRYPGCRVDSPNHTYSYSFAPKDWPQHFSPQGVLLEYFDDIATRFGIRDNIRLETEVKSAAFDEGSGLWRVETESANGEKSTVEVNAIITAVGQLNRPRFPDIKGVGDFGGPEFHSARWEHEHDLSGKRVVVIGTGASAFQFVPEIAKQAAEVTIFQRTPPWILPNPQYHDAIPEGKHWLLNHVPYYAKWFRFLMFWRTSEGLLAQVSKDPAWNEASSVSPQNEQLRLLLTEYIRSVVGDDPELFAKAVPNYPPAGKRMLIDNGNWLNTLKRSNVHVVTEAVTGVNTAGVVTADGKQWDADVLIYGTGFYANKFLSPMQIKGHHGVDLQEHWDGDPRAYLGVTIPGFPNLFCMYGPNTNIVVNGSIIFFSECEIRYILGCIALILSGGHAAIDCKQDVHDAYNEMIDEGNRNMAWGAPNVRSWYKNQKGRVTQNWPFTLREFWERTRAPSAADFNFLKAP